jgi:hypothetical protein
MISVDPVVCAITLPNAGSEASLQMEIPGMLVVSTGTPSGQVTVSVGTAEAEDDDDDVGVNELATRTSTKPIPITRGFARLALSPYSEHVPAAKTA